MFRAIAALPLAALALAAPAAAHDGVVHEAGLPRATTAQIHELAAAIAPYRDFAVAEREGWKKFGGDEPLMGEHWYHPDGPDYAGSDAEIDFSRPSNLMYTVIDGRRVLTGVAFTVRLADGEAVPQGFAGDADRWHVHDMLRAIEAALADRPILRWLANGWIDANYRDRGDDRGRIAMAHAWVTLPNPDGIFADANRTLPYLKLGLPAAHATGASEAAARGLTLATAGGCAQTIDGRLWIANAGRRVSRALHAACRDEAARITATLHSDAGTINAAAEAGWYRFDALWNRSLTAQQRARIDAMSEHGGHGEHGEHGAQGAGHRH